jgi:hypothetical protein
LKTKFLTLALLTALALAVLSPTLLTVNAQASGTIVMLDSIGGTTNPAAGAASYPDGTEVQLTATPVDDSFFFVYWVISAETSATVYDNPTTITVAADVTYAVEAVFQPIQSPTGGQLPSNLQTAAIVVVLPSAGGTTSPAAGNYALNNAENLMLTAHANSGWQFSHWIISGSNTDHGGAPVNLTPTDNPYNVNHGYGYTYNYQAVFMPTGSNSVPTPTPAGNDGTMGGMSMEMWIIIALVVVIVILLVAFGAFMLKKNKHP